MAARSTAPRVALIDGVRTPFLRPLTGFAALTTLDLATAAVRAVIARAGVPVGALGRIVFGQVVPSLTAPNLAREIVFDAGLPRTLDACSVTRACTTGYRAVIDLALAIGAGDVDAGIAGGADSTSDVPIAVSKPLARAAGAARAARARDRPDDGRARRGDGAALERMSLALGGDDGRDDGDGDEGADDRDGGVDDGGVAEDAPAASPGDARGAPR